MDVLSSRILLRPGDLDRSRRFYRDALSAAEADKAAFPRKRNEGQ